MLAYAGGVDRAGGDLVGDQLALDPDLGPAAGPGVLQPVDLRARLLAGLRVGERLAGPVGQRTEVAELARGGLGGHLRLLVVGCGHAPTRGHALRRDLSSDW